VAGQTSKKRKAPKSKRTKAAKPQSKAESKSAAKPKGGVVGETVADTGKKVADTGKKVGKAGRKVAGRARLPLVAGGAALVGAAGGAAIAAARANGGRAHARRAPRPHVSRKDIARTADRLAAAGEQIGRFSTGFRELRHDGHATTDQGRHRSPIEIVLDGLTARR
jgi:hypothetical protein